MIAFITAGHCHDSAGTIACQHILTYPYRHFFTAQGFYSIGTVNIRISFHAFPFAATFTKVTYSSTAAFCSGVIFSTSSCSGANTIKSTPKMVSGRVVYTLTPETPHL